MYAIYVNRHCGRDDGSGFLCEYHPGKQTDHSQCWVHIPFASCYKSCKACWMAAPSHCGLGDSSPQTDAQIAKRLSCWCQHWHHGQRLSQGGLTHLPICHANVPKQHWRTCQVSTGEPALPGPALWIKYGFSGRHLHHFISVTRQYCVIYAIICNCM